MAEMFGKIGPLHYVDDPEQGRVYATRRTEFIPPKISDGRLETLYRRREAQGDAIRIIDIGCGPCGYHPRMKNYYRDRISALGYDEPAVEVIGIDINSSMLQDAAAGDIDYPVSAPEAYFSHGDAVRMRTAARDDLTMMAADAAATEYMLPLQDDVTDVAYSSNALPFFGSGAVDQLVTELDRVLGEDGVMALESQLDKSLEDIGRG